MTERIDFDKRRAERFKQAYERAADLGEWKFVFDNREYLTTYAKYVLEYLRGHWPDL